MISVCITGSYASGKTYVLDILKNLGYKTFSADAEVKFLYESEGVRGEILKIIPQLREFSTGKIANIIYNDENYRKKLENFIHPLIKDSVNNFIEDNKNHNIIFAEIPLAYEANFASLFNLVVVCYCSEERRLKRAKLIPNFNEDIFKKIQEIQLSQEIKIEKADFTINTDKQKVMLKKEVSKLIKKILMCNI